LLRGADKSVTISQPVTAQLNRTGRAHSATPFMMLMSALAITLHRWSGQSDLVIGTVVAGRTHQEIENLIGCFMNFLPIRVQFGERDSGLETIERLKATVIESYAHQDCPFDKIVEAVNPSRKLNQNPLYNVGLLLQNYPGNIFSADGLVPFGQVWRTGVNNACALLTSGMTLFALESLYRGEILLSTPELNVAYRAPAASCFWRA
jgi:non-ribosomal peptide synthetase component F